ncbi:MAG: SAM-dependent methyltransferase [Thermoanaerobacterales bacterium]
MIATPAAARVADDIRRHGPVPFSRVVERALYDPEAGFYEVGGRSGRREGHFVTSPEVGALFGAVVARMLDEQWRALGEPPVFVVVEPGAGPGTLCRTVLAATPACSPALRYVLVERSAAQRRLHAERLRLEDPALAFPPVDPDTEVPVAEAPEGPICVSLAAMPRLPGPAVVLANELLDNLPFGLAERRGGSWCEVRVDLEPGGAGTDGGTRLVERLVPFADDTAALLERLAPGAAEGARAPVQAAARDWLRDALGVAGPGGRVVVFDYVSTTAEMAARPQQEWLRTYRGHRRGGPPLADLGTQDITCEVAVDQLALVREPDARTTQAEWLRAHGVDELVEEARRAWRERAHIGDLAAVAARSRVTEADALLDPAGLGGFAVLEWRP